MRKKVKSKVVYLAALVAAGMALLSACGPSEPQHTISYVDSERLIVADIDCVAIYTEYTNGSDKTAIPADEVSVKAFQNGVEIPPIVPTGQKTNDYIQCDTSVQSGVTANVVWLFQLDDDSPVSAELSGGETVEISLTE